jgi:predicted acyl esterase
MAACNGAPVRTIISSVAPPNFASLIENGSIKMTFSDYRIHNRHRKVHTVSRQNEQLVYANNRNKWDSLAYWLPKDRDFMNQVPNCKVPMLIEGSWQDKFFNADGIMRGLSLLNAPFSSYLGAVQGHGGDHSATEDTWHMQWFNDWFFYWLFDINNGILDAPKYQYASTVLPYSNNRWTFIHDASSVGPGSAN